MSVIDKHLKKWYSRLFDLIFEQIEFRFLIIGCKLPVEKYGIGWGWCLTRSFSTKCEKLQKWGFCCQKLAIWNFLESFICQWIPLGIVYIPTKFHNLAMRRSWERAHNVKVDENAKSAFWALWRAISPERVVGSSCNFVCGYISAQAIDWYAAWPDPTTSSMRTLV